MDTHNKKQMRFEGDGGSLVVSTANANGQHVICECYLSDGEQKYVGAQIMDQILQALHRWLSPPEWLRRGANILYYSGGILGLAEAPHWFYASVESGKPVLRIEDKRELKWVGKITLTQEHVERWLQQVEELRQWHIVMKGRDPLEC